VTLMVMGGALSGHVATQEFFSEQAPHAMTPHDSGWGRNGVAVCDLKQADEALVLSAVKGAHALAAPQSRARRTK